MRAIKCADLEKSLRAFFTKDQLEQIDASLDPQKTIEQMIQNVKDNKRKKYMQVLAQKRLAGEMEENVPGAATGGGDKKDYKRFLGGLVGQSRSQNAYRAGVEAKANAIMAGAHRELAELMEMSAPTKFGWTVQHGVHDEIVRAIFGQRVTDPNVNIAARAWKDMTEALRVRFNKVGGSIPKKQNWRLSQSHDSTKVSKAGFEPWKAFILQRLDFNAMETTRALVERDIRKQYDVIATGGMARIEPGQFKSNSAVGNRHTDHRYFEFKDADSWLEYQREFGNANVYGSMMEHIHTMSKEIAALETFGPNPALNVAWISDLAKKQSGDQNIANVFNREYQQMMGYTSPVSHAWAGAMSTWRNWETTIHLPSAAITAVTDPAFAVTISRMNGTPVMKFASGLIKNLVNNVTNRAELNKLAAEMHLGLDSMIDASHTASRYSDVTGSGTSARAAEFMLRVSGLSPWTIAGKRAYGMSVVRMLTDGNFTGRKGALNYKMFKRYGIEQADLDALAAAPRKERMGVKFVDFSAMPVENAEKFVAMIQSETRLAIPEPDIKTRAKMTQATRTGTLVGEAMRMGGQFKSFPAHIMFGVLNRIWHLDSLGGRMKSMSTLFVGTAVMGVVSQQLYEIARGREPMDWDNPKLWLMGLQRGGGLGLMGDMILQDHERYGGLFKGLAGPAAADFEKFVIRGFIGPLKDVPKDAIKGDKNKSGQKLLNTAAELTDTIPLNQLWYTRAVWDHYVSQAIHELADPKARKKERKRERRRLKEFGNKKMEAFR